jgi:hypothetical protein
MRVSSMKRRLLFLGIISVVLIAAMIVITDPNKIWKVLVNTDFSIMCCRTLYSQRSDKGGPLAGPAALFWK